MSKGTRKVVDARADEKGNITQVRLSGAERFIPVEQAIGVADREGLANAHAVHPKGADPYLRTNPDGKQANNLDEMAGDHRKK
jgi:hypothetical protein